MAMPETRVEHYLDAILGDSECPNYPKRTRTRKENYLHGICGMTAEIKRKIDAMASDMKYKGSVADYEHLPTNAKRGDVYTTADNGKEYVWDGYEWIEIGGGADAYTEIALTGESGTLNAAQIAMVSDNTKDVVITNGGGVFRLANKQSDLTYKTYINIDAATGEDASAKAIYIQLNPEAVNYGHWSLEDVDFPGGGEVNLYSGIGQNTDGAMTQKAVTDTLFKDNDTGKIQISTRNDCSGSTYIAIGKDAWVGNGKSIVIGEIATSGSSYSVVIGHGATSNAPGSCIALGAYSRASSIGEMNIGSTQTSYGYNNTNYRLLTGVHDPVNAHDAATKGYVDAHATTVTSVNNLLSGSGDITVDLNSDNDGVVIGTHAKTVTITNVPPTAEQGTLTEEQLAALEESVNSIIVFNSEIYRLNDNGHEAGTRGYSHIGVENGVFMIKNITVTLNTRGWVLTTKEIA